MRSPKNLLRPLVFLLIAGSISPAAAQTVVRHLEIEAALADRQVDSTLTRYRESRAREIAARSRAEDLAGELDRRLAAGGATVAELDSQAYDLAQAGARAESAGTTARLLRHELLEALHRRETLAAELRRVRGAPADLPDPITGTWELALEVGSRADPRRGLLDLTLDGTGVRGTLGLDDGSFGSVTGTFTGGALRLERVSAEAGLDMVLEGRVAGSGELRGTWRPLILGRGEPPGGTWRATRPDSPGTANDTENGGAQ